MSSERVHFADPDFSGDASPRARFRSDIGPFDGTARPAPTYPPPEPSTIRRSRLSLLPYSPPEYSPHQERDRIDSDTTLNGSPVDDKKQLPDEKSDVYDVDTEKALGDEDEDDEDIEESGNYNTLDDALGPEGG